MRARWIIAMIMLLQLLPQPTRGQAPVLIVGTSQYDLRARLNGRSYRLFVAPPEGYSNADTTRYPVLYVLDGNALFPMTVGAYRYLHMSNEAPALIIVGVGYPVDFFSETLALRWTDLTPSRDAVQDSVYGPRIGSYLPDRKTVSLTSGGGPNFLEVLRSEIVPFIDSRYRTSSDRALLGHSLGASLTAYALFTDPEAFHRYGILSLSSWWNGGDVYRTEAAFSERHHRLSARVYMSVGERENRRMVAGTDSLRRILDRRQYEGLDLAVEVLRNETHVSSVPGGITTALRHLYADKLKK
jgi:predicted alpha/beta superfamily hydrolase